MGEKWYDDLPENYFEHTTDKAYKEAFAKIREGLAQGLDFNSACEEIDVHDEVLRKQIIDDMLKVIIAEEHFAKQIPLDKLAEQLKVSSERLESAKSSMLDEVQDPPLKNYYRDPGAGST